MGKKKSVGRTAIIVLAFLVLMICFSAASAEENNEESMLTFTAEELKRLSAIDDSLCSNEMVMEIKKAGMFESFVEEIEKENSRYISETMKETLSAIRDWGIEGTAKVSEYKEQAQIYLNENYDGMKIDSEEFYHLSIYMCETVDDFTLSMDKKAGEDSKFAKFYFYVSMYYNAINVGRIDLDSYKMSEEILLMTAAETIEWVAQKCFQENRLDDFIEEFSATINTLPGLPQDMFPELDPAKIIEYAQTYALTPNSNFPYFSSGDCTNFVSQALLYGGLPVSYLIAGNDKNADGLVETNERWFHFKNSSATGYSMSTSWIRVEELYDYLSPNYDTFETTDETAMTAQLKGGYILQGRHTLNWKYTHSVVVVRYGTSLRYCGHTNGVWNGELANFYDGFHEYRTIKTHNAAGY